MGVVERRALPRAQEFAQGAAAHSVVCVVQSATVWAHPTLTERFKEAGLVALEGAIHLPNRKRAPPQA